jgi:hypothetical protein
MFTVTRYCVQEFVSSRCGIKAGDVLEFRELDDALRAGRQVGGRRVGLTIYRAVGEPPSGIWREPELIKAVGYVPQAALDLFRRSIKPDTGRGEIINFSDVERKAS